jgi:hypothetical protein
LTSPFLGAPDMHTAPAGAPRRGIPVPDVLAMTPILIALSLTTPVLFGAMMVVVLVEAMDAYHRR